MSVPELFVLPIELVSPPSRRRDRIDEPATGAAAGIPQYMHAEIDQRAEEVPVAPLGLKDDRYLQAATPVRSGTSARTALGVNPVRPPERGTPGAR